MNAEAGPTRCVVLPTPNAEVMALVTGLTVHQCSELVDTHIERGAE